MRYLSDKNRDNFFNHFIQGMDAKLQAQLTLEYTRMIMMERAERQKEYERMKEEIIREVLSRIFLTIDVADIIEQIEELKKAIDDLGK